VAKIALPDMRYCDISQNQIADVTPILEMFNSSNNLEIVILADNPACFKPAFRDRVC
jgi:hypothetical protein